MIRLWVQWQFFSVLNVASRIVIWVMGGDSGPELVRPCGWGSGRDCDMSYGRA